MKPSIKHLLVATKLSFIITLGSMSALASAADQEQRGKRGPEHLIEVLAIEESQQEQFITAMKQQHEKRMAIHEQYNGSRELERESMDVLHQETLEMLQDILTSEQLEKFTEMAKKRHAKGPKPRS